MNDGFLSQPTNSVVIVIDILITGKAFLQKWPKNYSKTT